MIKYKVEKVMGSQRCSILSCWTAAEASLALGSKTLRRVLRTIEKEMILKLLSTEIWHLYRKNENEYFPLCALMKTAVFLERSDVPKAEIKMAKRSHIEVKWIFSPAFTMRYRVEKVMRSQRCSTLSCWTAAEALLAKGSKNLRI